MNIAKSSMEIKLAKFVLVGTIGSILEIGLLALFVERLHFDILFANSASFGLAIFFCFISHRLWTFRNKDKREVRQFLFYLVVSLLGLWLSNLLLLFFIDFGLWYLYAKIISVVLVGIYSFSINNFFTFRNKNKY